MIRGLHSEFTLPVEDASLFPEVPDFSRDRAIMWSRPPTSRS